MSNTSDPVSATEGGGGEGDSAGRKGSGTALDFPLLAARALVIANEEGEVNDAECAGLVRSHTCCATS